MAETVVAVFQRRPGRRYAVQCYSWGKWTDCSCNGFRFKWTAKWHAGEMADLTGDPYRVVDTRPPAEREYV